MAHILTITEAETQVREFAAQFPTANVLRGIALCESGRISWFQLYDIARSAMSAAQQAVTA